jgi:hypothetical protein
MSIRMTKENLQSLVERDFHIRPMEVRLPHSSDEANESPWSEGGSKLCLGFSFLAPFSEKIKARQR